jgi:hypothetical protein
MTIEIIVFLGFVFAAASLASMAYERRMDVLYGPYIENSGMRVGFSVDRLWTPAQSVSDCLCWKARNMIYLASVLA